MIGIARECAHHSTDNSKQRALKEALDLMQSTATNAVAKKLKHSAFERLGQAARNTVTAATNLAAAAQTAAVSNRNQSSQLQLNQAMKMVTEIAPSIISAVRAAKRDPGDSASQLNLISQAKSIVTPATSLIAAAKTAATTTGDSAVQAQLVSFSRQTLIDLRSLKFSLDLCEVAIEESEFDKAISTIKDVYAKLTELKSSGFNALPPLPHSTEASCEAEMKVMESVKVLTQNGESLLQGAHMSDGGIMFSSASALASGIMSLEKSVPHIVQSMDEESQDRFFEAATNVACCAEQLLLMCKGQKMRSETSLDALSETGGQFQESLNHLLAILPTNKKIESAIGNIQEGMNLFHTELPTQETHTATSRQQVSVIATSLLGAANSLVAASGNMNFSEISKVVQEFSPQYTALVEAVKGVSGINSDTQTVEVLGNIVLSLGHTSKDLLTATGEVTKASYTIQSHWDNLAKAGKAISESIVQLLSVTAAASPAMSSCNTSLSILTNATNRLTNIDEVPTEEIKFAQLAQKLKLAAKNATGSINYVSKMWENDDQDQLAKAISQIGECIYEISDVMAQAAYLLGIMDPLSTAGQPAKIESSKFTSKLKAVREAVEALTKSDYQQASILHAAAIIAKNTSFLCNLCKELSQDSNLPKSSQIEFSQYAKTVAASTAALVPKMKQHALTLGKNSGADCAKVSVPLLSAIESLCAFVKRPEYTGKIPKISPSGRIAQKPLVDETTKTVSLSAEYLKALRQGLEGKESNRTDPLYLLSKGRLVTDNLRSLVSTLTTNIPGQKECDDITKSVYTVLNNIDTTLVEIESGSAKTHKTLNAVRCDQECKIIADTSKIFLSLCEVVAKASKLDAIELSQSVSQIPQSFSKIAELTVELVSVPSMSLVQSLELLRGSAEALLAFIAACKLAGGNVENDEAHDQVDKELSRLHEAVRKFMNSLDIENANTAPEFAVAIDDIESQLASVSETVPVDSPYQSYSSEIERIGSQYLDVCRDITRSRITQDLPALAERLHENFISILFSVRAARTSAEDGECRQQLENHVLELASASIKALEAMRVFSRDSKSPITKSKLLSEAREVSTMVKKLVEVAQNGAKGAIMCNEVIARITEKLSDLENTTIFAKAGQLDSIEEGDNFSSHQDQLLAKAKTLSDVVKELPSALDGSQEALANNLQSAGLALDDVLTVVTLAATSITSAERNLQTQLLEASREVALKLASLTSAVSNSYGKGEHTQERRELESCLKEQVFALMELIRVTKVIGEISSQGDTRIKSMKQDIESAIAVFLSPEVPEVRALPVEVADNAKQFARAAAHLVAVVSSGQSENVHIAAGRYCKDLCHLIESTKASVNGAPSNVHAEISEKVQIVAQSAIHLVEKVSKVLSSPSLKHKQELNAAAKQVASSVNIMVDATQQLVPEGYVDPNDPNIIAERELLSAAHAIEAAAKKLASYQVPDENSLPVLNVENMSFNETVVQAARAIASATSALIRSATAAQREILSKSDKTVIQQKSMYHSDGTWTEGLVSAARMVASHVSDLCEAASLSNNGSGQREQALAAAKGVNSATAQLLSAAQAKTDTTSDVHKRLRAAGKSVTQATEQLVKAVQDSIMFDAKSNTDLLIAKDGKTGSKIAEFEAQTSIIKMEAELTKARQRLLNIRKGKYGGEK
ncbi:Talin-1 [Gonapodya sp. JEL0774]|nr:Talin-1 [Gonapodya sp. JEL0774]